jgi:hypothetical protein
MTTMAAATINHLVKIERHTRYAWRIVYAVFFALLVLTACAPGTDTDLFVPPTAPASPTVVVTIVSLWTETATVESALEPTTTPTPDSTPEPDVSQTPTPEGCTSDLKFLEDLTVPDGSLVEPGQKIDKQWRVQNSGTCDWGARYRLKLVGGFPPLGAELSQQLFPARAGSEATIQIFFIAPPASGLYRSAWIAYGPDDQPFGEMIFIEFVVP